MGIFRHPTLPIFFNLTSDIGISKSTFSIAKNLNLTLNIYTPFMGPYGRVGSDLGKESVSHICNMSVNKRCHCCVFCSQSHS